MENGQKQQNIWPHIGNEHITNYLTRTIVNDKVAHGYIFLGPNDLGKSTTANFFAKILLCHSRKDNSAEYCGKCPSCQFFSSSKMSREDFDFAHGDYHLIRKEKDKKNITIDQVREFIRILSLSSFANAYKIGVIKNAEALSEPAANALLKTMEEPNKKVVIILIGSNLDAILPTLVSRSQVINFYPVRSERIYHYLIEKHDASRDEAKNISRLALGRPALAIKLFEDKNFLKEYMAIAETFLDFFSQGINERLASLDDLFHDLGKQNDPAIFSLQALSVWEALMRDLLLLNTQNGDLVQHSIVLPRLRELSLSSDERRMLRVFDIIEASRGFINNNIKPKLALEYLSINI